MSDFKFNAALKMADQTLAAIDAAGLERERAEAPRPHLGASQIGKPCERALWYDFHWATPANFEARMLRLFARGQREENVLAGLLRDAGITVHQVDATTGRQFNFHALGGHFGGSMDGCCIGLPEAPKTWHVLEFKTHNARSFKLLQQSGVKRAKPEHWSQMQCYMMWTGMKRALYMAVCKDTDELHLERVDYDEEAAKALLDRAKRIIDAEQPPERIGGPDYWVCKMCPHYELCHGTAAPAVNCRTCTHSTAEPDGTWSCDFFEVKRKDFEGGHHMGLYSPEGKWIKWLPQDSGVKPGRVKHTLTLQQQREGCAAHRFNPYLLAWAQWVGSDAAANTATYEHDGGRFTNGAAPDGLSSEEIRAAADKHALALVTENGYLATLRRDFDAKVMG